MPERGLISALLKDPTGVKVDPLIKAAASHILATGGLAGLVVDGMPVAQRYFHQLVNELLDRGKVLRSVPTPTAPATLHAKAPPRGHNRPGDAYMPKGTISMHCLACGGSFKSVSTKTNRLCETCKADLA